MGLSTPQVKRGCQLRHWCLERAFQRIPPAAESRERRQECHNQRKGAWGWGTTGEGGARGEGGRAGTAPPTAVSAPLSLQVLVLGEQVVKNPQCGFQVQVHHVYGRKETEGRQEAAPQALVPASGTRGIRCVPSRAPLDALGSTISSQAAARAPQATPTPIPGGVPGMARKRMLLLGSASDNPWTDGVGATAAQDTGDQTPTGHSMIGPHGTSWGRAGGSCCPTPSGSGTWWGPRQDTRHSDHHSSGRFMGQVI